jgi:hypothetical protein
MPRGSRNRQNRFQKRCGAQKLTSRIVKYDDKQEGRSNKRMFNNELHLLLQQGDRLEPSPFEVKSSEGYNIVVFINHHNGATTHAHNTHAHAKQRTTHSTKTPGITKS